MIIMIYILQNLNNRRYQRSVFLLNSTHLKQNTLWNSESKQTQWAR